MWMVQRRPASPSGRWGPPPVRRLTLPGVPSPPIPGAPPPLGRLPPGSSVPGATGKALAAEALLSVPPGPRPLLRHLLLLLPHLRRLPQGRCPSGFLWLGRARPPSGGLWFQGPPLGAPPFPEPAWAPCPHPDSPLRASQFLFKMDFTTPVGNNPPRVLTGIKMK